MQRFKTKNDVIIGARIVFDNTTRLLQDVGAVKTIGDIISINDTDDNIVIDLYLAGKEEPIRAEIPYFLLQ